MREDGTTAALRVTVLVVLLAFVLLLPPGGPLTAAGIWMLCVVVLARSHPNRLLSLACLYLLLLGVFHLGLVAPLAAGIRVVDLPSWIRSPHLPTALRLFCVATVAFSLGARLHPPAPRDDGTVALPPQRELFAVGLSAAGTGAVMLWVGVWQLGILSSSYALFFERAMTDDVRFFGFGLMLFPVGLLVAAVGASRTQMTLLAVLLMVVLGPLFVAGFRGPAIVQAAALIAVWARKAPRVARGLALAGVAAALVLVPAIRAIRDRDEGSARPVARVDPSAVLAETGGSIFPLMVTADRVASGAEPLWLGRSYLMAARRIVPNFATRWTRPGDRTLTPSSWATLYGADPWTFEHGGGVGYSGVAEPYLNFGTPGVVLIFLLLGLLVERCDAWLSRDPFAAAVGAASFGYLLWTVRNDMMELFRASAIAATVVFTAWLLARARSRNQREGAAPGVPSPQARDPLA